MLSKLPRDVKSERKNKAIWDIVLYGSSARGKTGARDIDIAIIFREGTLKERLTTAQDIKLRISRQNPDLKGDLDIKGILWEELFQESFFARSGIFLEGISLFDGKTLASKIGFEGYSLYTYSLQDKSHTDKVKFNYLLSGREKAKGIIATLQGFHVGPGSILMPLKHSEEFDSIFKRHHITFQKRNVLIQHKY